MGDYGEKQRRAELFCSKKNSDAIVSIGSKTIIADTSLSLRAFFLNWLYGRHALGYTVTGLMECIDQASTYIRKRGKCSVDIWSISQYTVFKTLYNKLMGDKEFWTIDGDTYNYFIKAGEYYLKFLEEKANSIEKKLKVSKIPNLQVTDSVPMVAKVASQGRNTNYYYSYKINGKAIINAISVPSIYALHFSTVKKELIIPYLNNKGINGYTDLTYERAKNAEDITPVPAHTITPVIHINGVNYDTLTGAVIADSVRESVQTLPTSLSQEIVETSSLPVAVEMEEAVTVSELASQSAIDPEAVIVWLITQPNANGTLYLENVARQYMSALRSAPSKLDIPVALDSRNVFTCHTPEELNYYWDICKAAPNYKQVNIGTSGAFSAGMGCMLKYLQHLSDTPMLSAQTHTSPAYVTPAVPSMPVLNTMVIEQLTGVLSARFTNGYRLNSPIELVRFKSFAEEDLDEKLTLTDDELKSYIAACGTTYDGKVYAVSAQAKERIKELVEEYFANGAQAIFHAEFYAKNENWLFGASVMSEDMLIGIIRRLFPKLSFTQTYFGYTNASVFAALESEILRVWDGDVLLTYDQLAERLPYIPLERIKYALGQNGDFIWSSVETFSHISRIEITEEEREAIRAAAVRECNARGYVSITDLPFGGIEERNYELSITAVHNAIYRICLSDRFDKKGKIVTRKGDVFDALIIMKEYCRTIEKCTLDDLLNFEKELTGEVHRWIPMEAGNTILVRVDKENYVADRYVHFNADQIDEAMELVVNSEYLPLKSFTTFGAFPDCGQTWNLFLLESYCRRFSRKFRFDTPSVNSRNAGTVIRKSCAMDYTEIMTDAVANADVPLKDMAVSRFLFDSGYTGRSTTAKVSEIIDKAKAIRERKD